MQVIYVLSGILVLAVSALIWLFFSMKKGALLTAEPEAVPITNVEEIRHLIVKPPEPLIVTPQAAAIAGPVVPAAVLEEEQMSVAVSEMPSADAVEARSLKEENEFLCARIAELERSSSGVRQEEDAWNHLKAENIALKAEVDAAAGERAARAQELDALRRDMDTRLLQANDAIAGLQAENAGLKAGQDVPVAQAAAADLQARLDSLSAEVEGLRRDNESLRSASAAEKRPVDIPPDVETLKGDLAALRRDKARVEARVEELEQLVRAQEEKNDLLQYELTKSRAEAAGLERICANARRQFEGAVPA